ncbi:hypothetical protein Tco_1463166 [Tanacetum coccineum]
MSDSQWTYSSYHLEGKVIFEGVGSVTAWVAEGGRMMLCYVQGSGRRKRKKGVSCGSGRQENYRSGRRDCDRIRIWYPGIKIYFRHHLEDNVVVKEWGMIRPRQHTLEVVPYPDTTPNQVISEQYLFAGQMARMISLVRATEDLGADLVDNGVMRQSKKEYDGNSWPLGYIIW